MNEKDIPQETQPSSLDKYIYPPKKVKMENTQIQNSPEIIISNNDLIYNKYSIDTIEQNIQHLKLGTILVTQKVTPEFCIKYIFDKEERYAKDEKDKRIYVNDVLYWQRHITKKDLFLDLQK